ncbi:MAG: hypothetical protein ACRBFS_11905 [Aureispira sp.]
MSIPKYITLHKGDQITYKGNVFKIVHPARINVKELEATRAGVNKVQPVDKAVVLAIIHKEIDVLMDVGNELMNKGITDEELLFEEEIELAPNALNPEIRNLKVIFSKIEKL